VCFLLHMTFQSCYEVDREIVFFCYGEDLLPFGLFSVCCEGKCCHPVSQVVVGGHFVFVRVIGGVVDGCICGCGFTIYVNFYFIRLPD
jgi:hypothetical protein